MVLKEIKIKLPKEKEEIENFYENCEKRKKFIKDTPEHYKKHLEKAKHDLGRAIAEFKDRCWDWTVVKAYYAIHHAANALLSRKKGFFCKDHSCLIIALRYHNLINESLFKELSKLNEAFSNILSLDLTFQLRKIRQYDVDGWQDITERDAKTILDVADKLTSFVEQND